MNNKRKIITFYPNGEYYFHKGLKAYETKDLYRSKKYLQRAIRFEPREPDYLCQLAAVLAELEEYDASNKILEKVVTELDPDLAECYFFRANNFVHLGSFDEAEEEIHRYIATEPDGEFVNEARELLELLREEDEETEVPHEKGRLMLQHSQFEEAASYLRDVVAKQPDYWEAHNYLALAYFYLHQYKRALTTLEYVLNEQPGDVHALCNLAVFYRQLDVDGRCRQVINKLKGLYPMSAQDRCKLGSTFMLLGEYEDAARWLKSAEKSGIPAGGPFYYWLAVSCYFSDDLKNAERAWNRIRSFDFSSHHPFQYSAVQEMLLEEEAADNPLLRSLLDEVIQKGDSRAKCFALFVLRQFGDDKAIEKVRDIEAGRFEDQSVKRVAANILLEQGLKGQSEESVTAAYRVFTEFQDNVNSGDLFVEDYMLYDRWFKFAAAAHEQLRHHNINAWTAALHYSWMKNKGKKVTQKALAKRYDKSVSTIGNYAKKLKPLFD